MAKKEVRKGILWKVGDEYVFTVGHDMKTHRKRLSEHVGDAERKIVRRDVVTLGVREVEPTFHLKPLDLLENEQVKENVFKVRDAIVEYLKDKDETTVERMARELPPDSSAAWNFALAIAWMIEERWIVQSYRMVRRDNGEILPGRYDNISEIPDDFSVNGEPIDLDSLDLMTELLKTSRFGKED